MKVLVNVACDEARARCVVFNFRGRGGLGLKSPRTYCAANSDDLSEILDHLKLNYPNAPVVAVGNGHLIRYGQYILCISGVR